MKLKHFMSTIHTSRRDFLKIAGKTGAFLMVGFNQAGSLFAAPLQDLAGDAAGEVELNSFILITPDNRITIFNPRPEMGQGTWQAMPALIAEELEVDFKQIDIRITTGDKRHGPQGVGGSGSVRKETDKEIPVVHPPPGSDVYLVARLWDWWPIIELEKDKTYKLHLTSMDFNHGFSLQPVNINIQVVPGYEHVVKVTPNQSGTFSIVCNEFCGIGHANMAGRIYVK